MKVVVTGGAGYIGCWLTRLLVNEGHSVVVMDRSLYPSGETAIRNGWAGDVEYRDIDIRTVGPNDLAGVDAVCHLAGLSNDPTADFDPVLNQELNVVATEKIGWAAAEAGIERFTFASSASVYGFSVDKMMTEDHPVDPKSGYAKSKYDAEQVLLGIDGLDPVIFRQATVGGWSPRMRWDLVVNTMTLCAIKSGVIKVHAGGEACRPLLDVRDVANAHILAINSPIGGIYNLGYRRRSSEQGIEGYTIGCLALWISHVLGELGIDTKVEGDWSRNEGRSYDISSEKFRETFCWEPEYSVRETVEAIVSHYAGESNDSRNIDWMKMLDHAQKLQDRFGSVL